MTFEEWCEKERLGCQYSYQLDALEDAWNAGAENVLSNILKAHRIRPRGKSTVECPAEDYVIVPVEPTDKMIDAWWEEVSDGSIMNPARIYKVMILAAQEE